MNSLSGPIYTAECQDAASELRAYCESKFQIGPSTDGPLSVTGEPYTELCKPWHEGFESAAEARLAAKSHFDSYADGKIGALYWRKAPEIAFFTSRQKYAYYMRLLISDKPRKS